MEERDDDTPEEPRDFETLALPFLKDVARFALSLTRDETEANDLVQETFLRGFRGWHTFKTGRDPRKWLFTICRNTFLRLRQRDRFVQSADGDLDALPVVMSHVQAVNKGLGDLFDRVDLQPAIERAVNALPEPHRSAVLLVDVEGYGYGEAAEVLQVPIGTVRSRLFRARRTIQEALIAYAEDAGLIPSNTANSA